MLRHEPSAPPAGLVLGPFLARVLLVVRRDVLLPWLLCPHRPFSPAIGTVKHPREIPPSRLCPSCHHVVMRRCVGRSDNSTLVSSIGVLPFIEGSLRGCTSGLVAVSRGSAVALVDSIVKSTLRVSLLKVATRTAVARMWLGDT